MNICILRVRKGKKKKDYRFESVSDAAKFEAVFRADEEIGKVKFEVISGEVPETKYLLQELARDPEKYAEMELIRWFYPAKNGRDVGKIGQGNK